MCLMSLNRSSKILNQNLKFKGKIMSTNTRIRIHARLAFPRLNKPEAFNEGDDNKRYSASFIIDKGTPDFEKVVNAMKAAAIGKWGEEKGLKQYQQLVKSLKVCLINGDDKPDVESFHGHFVVNAAAQPGKPPSLVYTKDGQNVRIADRENQTIIYSGCYVNVILNIWAQDNNYGKRINASISGVQFAGKGDPLGGGAVADVDEFEAIEVADSDIVDETGFSTDNASVDEDDDLF